jgi:hypothetical protein
MQLGPSLHRLGSSSLVNSYLVEPHSSQRQAEPRSWIWSCGSCFPATQDAGASTVRLAPWRWRVARRGRGAAIVLGVLPRLGRFTEAARRVPRCAVIAR